MENRLSEFGQNRGHCGVGVVSKKSQVSWDERVENIGPLGVQPRRGHACNAKKSVKEGGRGRGGCLNMTLNKSGLSEGNEDGSCEGNCDGEGAVCDGNGADGGASTGAGPYVRICEALDVLVGDGNGADGGASTGAGPYVRICEALDVLVGVVAAVDGSMCTRR